VQATKTAQEAWNNLCKAFNDNGLTRRVGLLRALITTHLENCDSVDDYINHVINTAHKLTNIGFKVSDEWIGILLLAGLPDFYKPMIMGLESSGIRITGDTIKTKLLQDVKSSDYNSFVNSESALINKHSSKLNVRNKSVNDKFRDATNVTSRVITVKTAINVSQDLKRKAKIKKVKLVKTILRQRRSVLFSPRAPSIGKVGISIREPPRILRTIKIGYQ